MQFYWLTLVLSTQSNAKLTASIEEENQAATENEATVRRLQAKIDTISAILDEVNACNRLLSDCEEGIKNYETLNRQNAINEEKIGKKELDMQELQNKEQVNYLSHFYFSSIPIMY